jgi:hypothetical protein
MISGTILPPIGTSLHPFKGSNQKTTRASDLETVMTDSTMSPFSAATYPYLAERPNFVAGNRTLTLTLAVGDDCC